MKLQCIAIIGRIAIFLSLFIVIIILLDWRFSSMYPDYSAAQFHELLHSTNPADVIILGSSTTVYGYNTAIMRTLKKTRCDFTRTFNFGLLGAQAPFYRQWYTVLFRRYYHQPSLVIVSLDWFSPGGNDPHRMQATLEQNSRYIPWDISLKLFLHGNNQSRITLLMNLIRIMQAGPDVRYFFYPRDDSSMRGYDHGYMPLDRNIDVSIEAKRVFTIDESFQQDLSSVLDEIQRDGSQIVLVQMPVYKPQNIESLKDTHFFADIAQSRGIPYIDYNGERYSSLNIQTNLFADWSHLNREGSKIFTTKFRDDLEQLIQQSKTLCQ